MAVKMRLMRQGRKNRPRYRIVVTEARQPRDGAYIESLGSYDPFVADDLKKVKINTERAEYWLGVGAQPSETVLNFLKARKVAGLIRPKRKRKRRHKSVAAVAAAKAQAGTKARKPPKKPRSPEKKGGEPSE